MTNDEVSQPQKGEEDQVSGPQVPLLGHRNDACEPWGYVAPAVADVMMRATGVRHIYLINSSYESVYGLRRNDLSRLGVSSPSQASSPGQKCV